MKYENKGEGTGTKDRDDMLMDHMNANSRLDDLKVTDIRIADIVGAPTPVPYTHFRAHET